ncbi:DapH/DapD/GlmU-related protein [Rhodococcus sp. JG-3]|uniref:DapH/DapD/GlmU-related protein n=1 Tax=Rhodococcus sp. JG-3 TaxID=1305835 RepID=UPI0009DE5732|nr:DapH/DapD/GlmU-related protein [Rhodococcus sp. JG-3]
MDKLPVRDLSRFTGAGYERGRGIGWQLAWLFVWGAIGQRWWCPNRARISILRVFGAHVGSGVILRHGVKIHWPWKLKVGDNSWIGEASWILNLEPVTIGSNVCISQGVLLCTGSHDRFGETFEFDNGPIVILDGVWIAARAVVLRGVEIGRGVTVGCNSVVRRSIAAGTGPYPG